MTIALDAMNALSNGVDNKPHLLKTNFDLYWQPGQFAVSTLGSEAT